MPSAEPTSRPLPTDGPSAGGDELDDLFNYDFDDPNDPFSDNYKALVTNKTAEKDTGSKGKDDDLGLDNEVDNKKIRVPRVKLDEHRYEALFFVTIHLLTQTKGCYPLLEFPNYGKRPEII